MPDRIYIGSAPRGHVRLGVAGRVVPFERGVPVEFSADEAAMLPADEWATPKKAKASAEAADKPASGDDKEKP